MSDDQLLLIFALSSAFMNFQDLITLYCSSKRFQLLPDHIHELSLLDGNYSDKELSTIGLQFPFILDLTMRISNWVVYFNSLPKLNQLKIYGGKLSHVQNAMHKSVVTESITSIKSLNIIEVNGYICNGMYSFLKRLPNLRRLEITRCMPLILSELSVTLKQLSKLEELHITNCFSDRNQLIIQSMESLRYLSIRNCANLIGLTTIHGTRLVKCSFENCPIPASSIEHILQHSSQLRSLIILKCIGIVGTLKVASKSLHVLTIQYCDHLNNIQLSCPHLMQLQITMCSALHTVNIVSNRLVEMDLTGHSQLTRLCFTHSPYLQKLVLTGCTRLGTNLSETTLSEVTDRNTVSSGVLNSMERLALSSDEDSQDSDSNSDTDTDYSNHNSSSNNSLSSDYGSSKSARQVSSKSILGIHNDTSTSTYSTYSASPEPYADFLYMLHTACPILNLRSFIRYSIYGTTLCKYQEQMEDLIETLCPYVEETTATTIGSPKRSSNTHNTTNSSSIGSTKYRVVPQQPVRKPRRAKKTSKLY